MLYLTIMCICYIIYKWSKWTFEQMNTLITSLIVSFFVLSFAADAAVTYKVVRIADGYTRTISEEVYYVDLIRDVNQNKVSVSLWDVNNQPLGYVTITNLPGRQIGPGSNCFNLYPYGFYPDDAQLVYSIGDEPGSYGSGTPQSWFVVHQISYTALGLYNKLDLTFSDGYGNLGILKWNVDNIPEPGPILLSSLSLLFFWRRRRKIEGK